MKVILKENLENLGSKGDIVNVAGGFGRNYLIPKKLALEVTKSNMKMIEMEQAALKKRLEKARMSFQDVIQQLSAISLTFIRKAAEKDVIFGSVSVTDIKEELEKVGIEIEKKKILLTEPIKRLGNYTVPIKVFLDDRAEIKVQVIAEEEKKKEEAPRKDMAGTGIEEKEPSAGQPAEEKAPEESTAEETESPVEPQEIKAEGGAAEEKTEAPEETEAAEEKKAE